MTDRGMLSADPHNTCSVGLQIWVYRSDRKECLTSRDDSPTRYAGGLPAGRSQRGSARHRRPFTTALPLRYPSEREPFAQTRGNSLPDKRFLPAPQGSLPEGAPPAGGGGVYRHGHFYPFKQPDKPQFSVHPLRSVSLRMNSVISLPTRVTSATNSRVVIRLTPAVTAEIWRR